MRAETADRLGPVTGKDVRVTDEAVEGWVGAPDGVRIAYRDHGGSGRGLVLVHGGGANLESMDQYADRLGNGRRTVAIDVRCCGKSDDAPHFRLTDAASDIAAVVDALDLGPVDVVGHSMGGFVGGFYGTAHASARVVSIDGFGPGMVTLGTASDHAEFRAFQDGMRDAFFVMTAPPETGDVHWRDEQIELLCEVFPRIGYTAPNARAMATRNFVPLVDGSYQRRPPRHLFADAFADDGDADILRMYRHTAAPTLIIRCTESGAPGVLDTELDALAAVNEAVEVLRLPMTHLAPAWDAIDDVVAAVEPFLDRAVPATDGA
jgi:pimeloyl-ACP methyl ester carboxylesterase